MNEPRYRSVFAHHPPYLLVAVVPPWLVFYAVIFRSLVLLLVDSPTPLPSYQLSVQGHENEPAASLHTDESLRIGLRPQKRVSGRVALHAFLRESSGRSHPWPVTFEAQDGGGFLLQAPVSKLPGLHPGRWQLVLRIDRPAFWRRFFPAPAACPSDLASCLNVQVSLELTAE